ncbi:MAG: endonuclease III domain-containing protein [Candidatus Woesearchaeota archaeon]
MDLLELYNKLLIKFGHQGWWPLLELGDVTFKPGNSHYDGYHPADYSFPKNSAQQFEICAGAILTQNTSWNQASKALLELQKNKLLSPRKILMTKEEKLHNVIKPAGYFRQKTRKLKEFSRFYLRLEGRIPPRQELLEVWGIGPETADSILLYAYKQPIFVVDAYTKRVASRVGFTKENADYATVQSLFMRLPLSHSLFNEYHALIIQLSKTYCTKNPSCTACPVVCRNI